MRAGADGFVSVHAARTNNPDGRFLFFHYPRLHAAGMRPQEPVRIFMNIKCVLHVPRRMILGQVEGCEIMPVVFNLRAFRNGKSESSEDLYDSILHDANGMSCSYLNRIARQGPI